MRRRASAFDLAPVLGGEERTSAMIHLEEDFYPWMLDGQGEGVLGVGS